MLELVRLQHGRMQCLDCLETAEQNRKRRSASGFDASPRAFWFLRSLGADCLWRKPRYSPPPRRCKAADKRRERTAGACPAVFALQILTKPHKNNNIDLDRMY